jgi:hypothetical protein
MSGNIKKLIPIIKIKNFPSREGVLNDFKSFITERKSQENYQIIDQNKPNKILLSVNNPNTAFKFTEKYNIKILSNPNYSNSECSLIFKKPEKINNSFINLSRNNLKKKPKLFLSLKKRKIKENNKYLSKSVSSISDYERKHWANIREKACIIDNDSPYIDKLNKEYNDKIMDMKKWIDKKNFNVFIGKASSIRNSCQNEIKNYVVRTPSLPPILYQFRKIQKTKWIHTKDFRLY